MKSRTKSTKSQRLRWWQWLLLVFGSLLLLLLLGFVGYFLWSASHSLPADSSRVEAAKASQQLSYTDAGSYYAIQPTTPARAGLIIYPGAFAEPSAYVGQYAALAERGIAVFVVRSPLNFALLDINRADRIMREQGDIQRWYVAGHSLGGVTACEYAKRNQAKLQGLILLASYCNGDARSLTIPVLSISASRDGLATPAKIAASRSSLPPQTIYVVIDGANHTLFGSFAKTQSGDGIATISADAATQQILQAIDGFVQPN
jgi:dienelactone hydrolase